MRKWLVMGCALLAALLVGCTTTKTGQAFKAGTYVGTAQGRNGPVVVEVTVDSSSILNIAIKEQHETDAVSDNALRVVPQQIVERQCLAVDSVSGASMTSEAIVAAAADALKKAGGDVEKLKTAPAVQTARAAAAMKPGVYYGEAYGKWPKDSNEGGRFLSPKVIKPIKVEVEVDASTIKSVKVLSCDDTPGFKE